MKKFTIVLLFTTISFMLYSQQVEVTNDFGFWGGVVLEKQIGKDFEISLEQQVRLYTNCTEFDDYLLDIGGKYKINRNFKLGANIRYYYDVKRWKPAENNLRYNLDLNYKGRVTKKFSVHYRLRYQQEFERLFVDFNSSTNFSEVRNKVKFKYELGDKNTAYISGEIFRITETFRRPYFNQMRFYIGDEFDTKIGEFDFSVGYEQELNDNYPLSFFFLKTIYAIKL